MPSLVRDGSCECTSSTPKVATYEALPDRRAGPDRRAQPQSASPTLGRLKGHWQGLPVQVKFLAIAIPLIVLLVAATLVVLEQDYYADQRAKLLLAQKKVSFSQALLLADPLRERDVTTVKRLLATIIANPAFVGAAVRVAGDEFAAVGDDLSNGDPALIFAEPITYGDQSGIYELGHLVTLVSDGPIRATMWARRESHLAIMAILALGLGIGMHIAYRSTIGGPLAAMVRAIRTARQTERPLRIAWTSPDEIGQLASALNAHVEREWTYKRELVAVNASLEERIMVRTRELSEALTQANQASAAIARLAMEDSLTGLPNRREFASRLTEAITIAQRRNEVLAVMLIDLDRFKNINDALGHSAGDGLLKQVADRLQSAVGAAGVVARLGGDEFAVLAGGSMTTAEIAATAERIVVALDHPVTVDGADVHAGGSIGISLYPMHGDTDETLMANADIALYQAKDGGRGRFCFFDSEMRAAMALADRIEADLRQALDLGELELFYQPKFDLATGMRVGFEALLRWPHPTHGLISPGDFLPVAEERGLMIRVGRAVIERATADVADWLAAGHDPGTIAVNIHPVELRRRDHIVDLLRMIEVRGLSFDRFVFEITENCVIGRGTDEAIELLSELRERGLALSLDDFGTGYASLKHLKDLPFDEIKIDQGFVADMTRDAGAAAIVRATIDLAHSLHFRVVAEGIETTEQIDHLKALGPIIGQGYALGRPMSADDAKALLAAATERSAPVAQIGTPLAMATPS